jgi:hypothetical protein
MDMIPVMEHLNALWHIAVSAAKDERQLCSLLILYIIRVFIRSNWEKIVFLI